VEHGIERMDEARTAIDAVVQLAQNTEQMVTAIATAAQEQSAASNEVSQTIAAMSGIASESAQASDQTANACKQLAELAGNLDRLVGQFQLRHAR
jgi:methyl-accepting chemotaxis protein